MPPTLRRSSSPLISRGAEKHPDAIITGVGSRIPARSTKSEGFIGSTASSVADTLEAGGRYLQEENLSGVAEEMTFASGKSRATSA